MPEIVDDKSQHCIPFLLERLEAHQQKHANEPNPPPFFLGLNGVQGAGKTVLVRIACVFDACHCQSHSILCSIPIDTLRQVSTLRKTVQDPPYNLPTAVLSADDIYLTHADQVKLASDYPDNPLLQHRGQPSTHDLPLGLDVFNLLRQNLPTKIPQYNKAAFSGQGDRVPETEWEEVNADGRDKVKVVIFEGWCVGFRAIDDSTLNENWKEAIRAKDTGSYVGRLGYNRLEDLAVVNDALRDYDKLTK